MENIRGSDVRDSHSLKNTLRIINEEVIQLWQEYKDQQKTLNRVQNLLGKYFLEIDSSNHTLKVVTPIYWIKHM